MVEEKTWTLDSKESMKQGIHFKNKQKKKSNRQETPKILYES